MQELKAQERKTHEVKCLKCGTQIEKPRTKFCCRAHQLSYNHAKTGYAATKNYYSASPRNFFISSLQKKKHKRENISAEFLAELFDKQNGLCAISKEPLTIIRGQGRVMTNASIDRIDSFKPYTEDNIQLVCLIVNLMKQQLTLEELKSWCYKIIRA